VVQIEVRLTEIIEHAQNLGAKFVGFASIDRWKESEDVPVELHPHSIWSPTQTVIVLGVPVCVDIAPNRPKEQSNVTSDLLDQAAYRLAVFLNGKGYPSVNIPQDSTGEGIAEHKTIRVFSHEWAGHYAEQGQVSSNKNLVPQQESSQLKLVSVLTAFKLTLTDNA